MREKLVVPEPGETARSSTGCAPRCPRTSITIPICRGKTAVCRCPISAAIIATTSPVSSTTCGAFPPTTRAWSANCSAIWSTRSTTNVDVITRYKEHYLEEAEYILVSYGSSARSAIHLAKNRRQKGERIGVLELQSIWPFPAELVRDRCANAKAVVVVEMNMGQVLTQVKAAVDHPDRVFLANRIDGKLITPSDIKRLLRVIQGRGV